MSVGGQRYSSAALPYIKSRYSCLCLGGTQGLLDGSAKSIPTRIRAVRSVLYLLSYSGPQIFPVISLNVGCVKAFST
jgi:hypothetical protein